MNLTHYVDFIRHVAGLEPVLVAAATLTPPGAEVEDAIAMTIGFEGGAVGTLSGSASTRGRPPTRFELWGEHGTLRLEPDPAIYTVRAVDGIETDRWCALPAEEGDPREAFVTRFAEAVLDGRAPDVTAADGLAVQAVVEAAYASAERGTGVALSELDGATA